MSVVEELSRLGGVATRGALVRITSRADVDRALAAGDVIVLARGRYALAGVEDARAAARGLQVRRADLSTSEVVDGVTSRDRTLRDCLRCYPFADALAVADSALRSGFPRGDCWRSAATPAARAAAPSDGSPSTPAPHAANPFESALRGIAVEVPGLTVVPQASIYDPHFLGRPDLVDERLRMILEADSFEWHGGREELSRDARRYNAFVVNGWLVLRFCWEDVMFQSHEVRAILQAAVAERTDRLCGGCRAA